MVSNRPWHRPFLHNSCLSFFIFVKYIPLVSVSSSLFILSSEAIELGQFRSRDSDARLWSRKIPRSYSFPFFLRPTLGDCFQVNPGLTIIRLTSTHGCLLSILGNTISSCISEVHVQLVSLLQRAYVELFAQTVFTYIRMFVLEVSLPAVKVSILQKNSFALWYFYIDNAFLVELPGV